jgi:hypothetical protein
MIKALVILLWPTGIAAILAATALLANRSVPSPPPVPSTMNGHNGTDPTVGPRSARSSVIGLLLILVAAAVVVYALTALLGMLAAHAGPGIDKPIYTWMIHHRVHFWKWVMDRVTKVGYTWTTWGAAAAAAVCLAAVYLGRRWLPLAALGAAVVLDHYLAFALRLNFGRVGPPDNPHGTFLSGGCDRIVVFYGLIAFLIWREVSGSKRTAVWAAGVVAALGFSEAYSSEYLTLHWFTDIVSGFVFGCLVLAAFIVTIRVVDGPARKAVAESPVRPVVSSRRATTRE